MHCHHRHGAATRDPPSSCVLDSGVLGLVLQVECYIWKRRTYSHFSVFLPENQRFDGLHPWRDSGSRAVVKCLHHWTVADGALYPAFSSGTRDREAREGQGGAKRARCTCPPAHLMHSRLETSWRAPVCHAILPGFSSHHKDLELSILEPTRSFQAKNCMILPPACNAMLRPRGHAACPHEAPESETR